MKPAHDLSPWGMFLAADIVVQSILVGLAVASVVTWTVWLAKSIELTLEKRRLRASIAATRDRRTIRDVDGRLTGPMKSMVHSALAEIDVSSPETETQSIRDRITLRLGRIEVENARRIARGTGVLATIGATAPFIGLFGTVWGIMNSFVNIAKLQTTNLAVVAPGIAEALLATAVGLGAAIPAVVIYNVFARSITGYKVLLGDASAEVLRLSIRELDMRRAAQSSGQHPRLSVMAGE
ncbi:MAG: tonB-system energizer ExbB [Hyphomicrobium sp.]